jgi:hypothetical protein
MISRHPPVVATWLLKRFGAGRHSESIAGDLIEQHAHGRSRSWYWRQVLVAIAFSRLRAIRARSWVAAKRTILHIAIEVPLGLGVITGIDQSRRSHDLREMLSPTFLGTMGLLLGLALLGFAVLRRTRRSPQVNGLMSHWILLFALASLGAGTFTWAHSTRPPACATLICSCQQLQTSIDEARH